MKKIFKKRKGQYDLIVSLFVIGALTIFMFMYLSFIGDINIRTNLDQVARKYILYLETADLTTTSAQTAVKNSIKSDLEKLNGVTCNTSDIKITSNGYGRTLTLSIKCKVKSTGKAPKEGLFGPLINRRNQTFVINKQSTAKY